MRKALRRWSFPRLNHSKAKQSFQRFKGAIQPIATALSPASNVSTVFSQQSATSPFAAYLTTFLNDVSLALVFTGVPSGRTLSGRYDSAQAALASKADLADADLGTQDEKLDTMQQDLSALVGTDKVQGLVSRNTDLLQGLVDRHQMWHDQDMEFRSTITLSVAQLADRHEVVAEDVRSIKWLVATFSGLRKLGAGTAKAVKESKVLWRIPTLLLTAWIAVVQIVHVVWPAFVAWLHRGKR